MDKRVYAAVGLTVGIFLAVQVGALALVEPFEQAGYQTVEDPTDPTNSLVYVGAILVATALMLGAIKLDLQWVMRGFVLFATASITYYVFAILLPPVVSFAGTNGLAALAALVVAVGLYVHPEWYVIDAAGVVMGMGAAGLFGISFGVLPAIVLLVVLAVYDAISVYGTEHMLTLASGVMDLKLPVVLVIPLSLSYSFLDAVEEGQAPTDADSEGDSESEGDVGEPSEEPADEDGEQQAGPLDRGALFIGLGDAVMPTILVASAGFFISAPRLIDGIALTLPSLGAMVGTLLGLLALLWMVLKGRAHAGLPMLNGGAILGYLVGAVAAGIPVMTALGL